MPKRAENIITIIKMPTQSGKDAERDLNMEQ